MAANNRIGSKRLVVGAHYGLRDWLAQRVTATIMAVYTVILLVLFFGAHDFSYEGWASISAQWMKLATFVTCCPLLPRLGRRARHLDGLRQARRPAPAAASR
jgi:succinate dehydrogenase / fumarate reductase membrane anchor subunit